MNFASGTIWPCVHGLFEGHSVMADGVYCNGWSISPQPEPTVTPKPDGWHTYHICGGLLRELTWSDGQALCVVCGQWFNARAALSVSP